MYRYVETVSDHCTYYMLNLIQTKIFSMKLKLL